MTLVLMVDLEYELRFALSSKTLRVCSIEDISNHEDISTFRKGHSTTRTVFQFLDSLDLPARVPLTKPFIDTNKTDHELFYCEVAVGQAIYASEENALEFQPSMSYNTFVTTLSRTPGYGMGHFNITGGLSKDGKERAKRENPCKMQGMEAFLDSPSPPVSSPMGCLQDIEIDDAYYIIKERSRLLPLYCIKFEYDHALELGDDRLCEYCYTNPSICFCYAEKAQLCMKCDALMHDNELTKRHQKHYFNDENTRFIDCALHSQVVDFWCLTCEVPICVYCKIRDSHSLLPEHNLIAYKDAWAMNLEALKSDRTPDHFINELELNLVEYQNSYNNFVEDTKGLKKLVRDEYQNTLNKIDHLHASHYKIVCGRYLEKKAELERIRKMKIFRPNNFLNFFKAMKEQRKEIRIDLSNLEIEPIRVVGGFKVNPKEANEREGLRPKRMSSDFYFESVE